MKLSIRLFSVLMAMVFLLSCLIIPTVADDSTSQQPGKGEEDARFTQKIVSVVYDTSGSMSNPTTKIPYAEYALRMLISLLGDNDILIIVPMNGNIKDYNFATTDKTREEICQEVINFTYSGNTPPDSMDKAINELVGYELKDKDNLALSKDDVEHWMVVITDGAFNKCIDAADVEECIEGRIINYPSLNTIYLGVSTAAHNLDGCELSKTANFTPYHSAQAEDIIEDMRDIANQLSGRYTLQNTQDKTIYTVSSDGLTVEVDLSKIECSFKSLSVIAQNCDAVLQSAVYNGAPLNISNPCVIAPGNTGLKSGYSAVLTNNSYLSGGKVTLTFSKPVSEQNLSILAEPALSVVSYLEYYTGTEWKRTDMQYINANLSKKDKIRVGYEVYELANYTKVDINKVFGNVDANVTYAGNSYKVGEDIPLVVGNNAINISVSVMDGAYKMYDSLICIIEENPTSYRIEAEHGNEISSIDKYTDILFKVFVNGKQTSKSELESNGYSLTLTAKDPKGNDANVVMTSDSDGKLRVKLTATDGAYGKYTVKLKVTSSYGISREKECELEYKQGVLAVKCEGPTEFAENQTTAKFTFSVEMNGVRLTKRELDKDAILSASVITPEGNRVPPTFTIEADGRIICDVKAEKRIYGDYVIEFSAEIEGVKESASERIKYYPRSIEVKKNNFVDKLPEGASSVDTDFYVLIDGEKITKDELANYRWSIIATAPGGGSANVDYNIEDDGTVKATLEIPHQQYGEYKLTMSFEVSADMKDEETHSVKYYISSLSLNTLGDGKFTATQYEMLTNTKSLQFELLCDNGIPLVFENGLTVHKVLVGSTDVTQYVTLDGNVMTYVPIAEHFGGSLPVGAQTVTVTVTCSDMPSIKATATASFDVTPTIYTLAALDYGNRHVDRFRLSEVDAAIHYQVLRDGVPISVEELQAALDSGDLKITDEKGTFGWKFWLPCGNNVAVETVNGQPVVTFRVTKDYFKPVDSYFAMFIFNGDKPITVTYNNVTLTEEITLTENITFDSSPVWSYIWRVLVILFIIHIILYIIGFFNGKCKSLPAGSFITMSIPKSDSSNVSVKATQFNATFWKRYSWHIWRFFPHTKKLWYNQPTQSVAKLKFGFDDDGNECYIFKHEMNKASLREVPGDPDSEAISVFKKGQKSKHPPKKLKPPVKAGPMRSFIDISNDPPIDPKKQTSMSTYCELSKDGEIIYLVTFVRRGL